ncbi:hypothetical protein B0H13DRAFT_1864693 [Mycena leptocephala]|nr:hypothetical protein B0H13DRAFT_1864693 [Mycena leptocephala]
MAPNLLCQTDKYSSARPREDSSSPIRTRFESFDFRHQCMRILEKTSGPVGDSETRTTMVSLAIPIVEFGSYDPGLAVFIPMQSLGSINETSCVVGFDQTSFILGSTADVFPKFNASSHLELNDPSGLQFSARLQKIIPQSNNVRLDGAIVPNAFHGRAGLSEAHEKLSTLANGGLDGANIPLQPLLVKARGMRAIIAHDATADKEDNFGDGTAIIAESRRRQRPPLRNVFFPVAASYLASLGIDLPVPPFLCLGDWSRKDIVDDAICLKAVQDNMGKDKGKGRADPN